MFIKFKILIVLVILTNVSESLDTTATMDICKNTVYKEVRSLASATFY